MQRDMLRFADVRNATTDDGIVVSGGANGFAQLSYASGVQDRAFQPRYQPAVATNPGGSTTQVQFNDAGAFGGDAGLTFNKTTNVLQLGESGAAGKVEAPSLSGASGLALTIEAGDTTFSGGTGGALTLRAGTPSAGPGGSVTVESTAGAGSNRAGGAITMTAGNASSAGTGSGGGFLMSAGAGPVSGTGSGGGFIMSAGASGSVSGSGGAFTMTAGDSADNNGGGFVMTAGTAISVGDGGGFQITAGPSADAAGGRVTITSGDGGTTGGDIELYFGSGTPNGTLILSNARTATTVGAAGGASALPATPTGYLIVNIGGTDRKIPYYAT